MFTNIRLDTTEHDKVAEAFKKYAVDNPGTRFLLAKETGTQTGKPHLQGWCEHTTKRTALRTYIDRTFPDLKGGKKGIKETRDIKVQYAYICKNKTKPGFTFEDCITNYTQEEYDEITKDLVEFLPKNEFFAKKNKSPETWWLTTLDILEDRCVADGRILYSTIPTVFETIPWPKRFSTAILKENLNGLIAELERRHCSSTKYRDSVMESLMHDPIFRHSEEEFKIFKKMQQHKNVGSSQNESQD